MKAMLTSSICLCIVILLWGVFYISSDAILTDFSDILIEHISTALKEGDFSEAEDKSQIASDYWENHKSVFYMLTEHKLIRETDTALARLKSYIVNRQTEDALNEISYIAELLLSIHQNESFSFDNIL